MTRAPLLLLLVALALTGCSGDPQEKYCETVTDHQEELTEIAASEDTGALFDALEAYDDLREQAPRDALADQNPRD